jgi:hypothetical protein
VRKTLLDVFAAAREHGCPIVHISRLAGADPFVAQSPCLGDAPGALIDLTTDDYLGIMAEIRRELVVEHDESLTCLIFTSGSGDPGAAQSRPALAPRTIAGVIDIAGSAAAIYYLMDSAGQETTLIYDGLRSFAEIQTYWGRRGTLVRALRERYGGLDEDVADLCRQLDRTVQLETFDLAAFARQRGLRRTAGLGAAS